MQWLIFGSACAQKVGARYPSRDNNESSLSRPVKPGKENPAKAMCSADYSF